MPLRIRSTADVALSDLDQLGRDLQPGIDVFVETGQIHLRSEDPPSWVRFVADAPWWLQTMGLYASVYVAELFKEAAKTTWKERATFLSTAGRGVNHLTSLARSLVQFRRARKRSTTLQLALPIPHDYFGVQFELLGREEDLVAAEIAMFVQHVPGIQALLEQEAVRQQVTGMVVVQILDDGSAKVTWMDKDSLEFQVTVLPMQ